MRFDLIYNSIYYFISTYPRGHSIMRFGKCADSHLMRGLPCWLVCLSSAGHAARMHQCVRLIISYTACGSANVLLLTVTILPPTSPVISNLGTRGACFNTVRCRQSFADNFSSYTLLASARPMFIQQRVLLLVLISSHLIFPPGVKGACINAASLALCHAGVPMHDLVASCAAGFLNSTPILGERHVASE